MTLQAIAHDIIPASMRDIGKGIYHLAKGDAREDECQKLIAGAIRVSTAALTIITMIAVTPLIPPLLSLITVTVINTSLYIFDRETSTLLAGTLCAASGLSTCATGVSLVSRGFFEGAADLLFGSLNIGIGWFLSRVPRDITIGHKGLLADKIDNFSCDWGSRLHRKLA